MNSVNNSFTLSILCYNLCSFLCFFSVGKIAAVGFSHFLVIYCFGGLCDCHAFIFWGLHLMAIIDRHKLYSKNETNPFNVCFMRLMQTITLNTTLALDANVLVQFRTHWSPQRSDLSPVWLLRGQRWRRSRCCHVISVSTKGTVAVCGCSERARVDLPGRLSAL